MEIRFDTPESQKLLGAILTGPEFKALDVQLAQVRKMKEREGRIEVRLKAERRFILVNVYRSISLDTIYVLSYHLERKGEPTPKQLGQVKAYEKELELLEKEKGGAGHGKD